MPSHVPTLPDSSLEAQKDAREFFATSQKPFLSVFAGDDPVTNGIEDDVLIWNSNNRHPMDDLMSRWLELGLVTDAQYYATEVARDEQNAMFIEEYKLNQANRSAEQIAEQRFEARAAMGPNVDMVNILNACV